MASVVLIVFLELMGSRNRDPGEDWILARRDRRRQDPLRKKLHFFHNSYGWKLESPGMKSQGCIYHTEMI